jgi:arabinofuranosyltransferase
MLVQPIADNGRLHRIWLLLIVLLIGGGILGIATAYFLNTETASLVLSPDHSISAGGLNKLGLFRFWTFLDGLLFLLIGGIGYRERNSDTLRSLTNIIGAIGLVMLGNLFIFRSIDLGQLPTEDAAILMRYAKHIGEGFGMVWNLGEHPVDGATDFLFTVIAGFFVRLGLSVEFSVRLLAFGAQFGIVLLTFWFLRIRHAASSWAAAGIALFLAFGPGFFIGAAYFGTSFFVLLTVGAWCVGQSLYQPADRQTIPFFAFSLLGILAGLTRPEGVLLALLMLCAVVVMRGIRKSVGLIIIFLTVYLVFGGLFFLWRWDYFGYPLPNPFYIKSEGYLHWASLEESYSFVSQMGLPFLLSLVVGLGSPQGTRKLIALCLVVFGFTSAFLLISTEMNFGGRYLYPIIPILVLGWFPIVQDAIRESAFHPWQKQNAYIRRMLWGIVVVFFLFALWWQSRFTSQIHNFRNDDYAVAQILYPYRHKGYSIALTEAGLLPLYSDWRTLDAYGLNDPWIAHHGPVTAEYIDAYHPEVIMFHAYYSPFAPLKGAPSGWSIMTETMRRYAVDHAYTLAAVFGASPSDTHYYFVRNDFPESATIISEIQDLGFHYPSNGEPAGYVCIPKQAIPNCGSGTICTCAEK